MVMNRKQRDLKKELNKKIKNIIWGDDIKKTKEYYEYTEALEKYNKFTTLYIKEQLIEDGYEVTENTISKDNIMINLEQMKS